MPAKELRFDEEARHALKHGADAVARTVAVTLGPRGRTVLLDKKFGAPLITSDGVTIARDLEFADHFENMGASLLKEAAIKTNDVAGDGTTTATVLARALLADGLQNLAAGAQPMALKNGIMKAADAAIADIRARSTPVSGTKDIERVATISSSDPEVGRMIANAFEKVGREGVVSVEEGTWMQTEVEVVEGMQFDRGYLSAYMVTDQATQEAVLEDARVLVTDAKISAVADLLPALETSMRIGRPLLVIAEDVSGEALATLVVNRMRGTVSAVAVKAPGFGDRKDDYLEDIAVLTGATMISAKTGLRLDQVRDDQLGSARRVTAAKETTTIVGGGGSAASIKARCEELRVRMKETESEWDREKLQERLARLTGGVAVVKVGGATETEQKERKARVQDAIAATRAAIEDGIVVGGGVAYVRAIPAVDKLTLDGDEAVGARIVARALGEPLRVIAVNAGLEGMVVVEKVRALTGNDGFDAVSETYGDLPSMGVIDPAKVVMSALMNAASIAGIVLTTEALVAEAPEKEEAVTSADHSHGNAGLGGLDDMDF